MEKSGDTIAAIATAPGRSGVAVIRVSGPEALAIAEKLTGGKVGSGKVEGGSATVSLRTLRDLKKPVPNLLDRGLMLVFRAPHSYTGEDVVEFQVHGGRVTPRRVLEACFAAGARLAHRGEFTGRAFLNGRITYEQAEGVLDLIEAKTDRAAEAALQGLSGRRQQELRALYADALELSTRLEHALDVSEAELPEGFLSGLRSQVVSLASSADGILRREKEGKLLRDGALVVLAGAPNAGKSSLMNALLEENRAIVSAVPGTTRDSIEEGLSIDGWPLRLVDTAGLRTAADAIEGEGVARARDLIRRADVVVALCPAETSGRDAVRLPDGIRATVIRVTSKGDLGRGPGLTVSAKTGEGLGELRAEIVRQLEKRLSTAEAPDDGSAVAAVLFRTATALAALTDQSDLVLLANAVRSVAEELGTLVGKVYSEDLLDALFSRFCVGK